jgi:hypothetical protein
VYIKEKEIQRFALKLYQQEEKWFIKK